MAKKGIIKQAEISRVEVTPEKICGRGDLFFFLRYIETISVHPLLQQRFGFLKSSGRGLSLYQFAKQLFAHFVDAIFRNGTRHSNPGNDFIKAIGRLVNWIRRFYANDIPVS